MPINNNTTLPLRLTLLTLTLIISFSVIIIVLLVVDKRDGFMSQVDSVLYFGSSCSIYIGQKYQLLFYNLKLRFISIGVVLVGVISGGLLVVLIIVRRKEMFIMEEKGNGVNDNNCKEKQQQYRIEDIQTLLPQTNRSVRQSLLNKSTLAHSLPSYATPNQNISPTYPFNPLFFFLFSIIIIVLILTLGFHLSFFIQWTVCGRYDISEMKIIVFIILQGIQVILVFISYCMNLNRRFKALQQGYGVQELKQQAPLQAQMPSLSPREEKKQQEQNKVNKQNKIIPRHLEDKKIQIVQQHQHQIAKTTPIYIQPLTTNQNSIDNNNNKQARNEITSNTKSPIQQTKSDKQQKQIFNQSRQLKSNNIQKKQAIKKQFSLQLQQIKQVQSNCQTINQHYQVNQVATLISTNNNVKIIQSIQFHNNTPTLNSRQNKINNGDNQKINSTTTNIIQTVNQIARDKPQTVNSQINSYVESNLESLSIKKFTISDQNYLLEKVFGEQQQVGNIMKMQPKQKGIQMTLIQNIKQQPPSHHHHKQTIISQPTILNYQPSTVVQPILRKKKQLNFCSSVYSIEQSSPFSVFTTNVITSRIRYSNQIVLKPKIDVTKRQFQQLLLQEDDDQRYMTNRRRDGSGLVDESYSGYHVSRQERFSPSDRKVTMQQQYLPQQRYFRKPPSKRIQPQVPIPPSKHHPKLVPIPQKQQVYKRSDLPESSQLMNNPSGEDSFRSGSSYYHNSIRKQINTSGNRIWDSGNDKSSSKKVNSTTMQQIILSDINNHSIVHDVHDIHDISTPKSLIKKNSDNIFFGEEKNNNIQQNNERKFKKDKQKKVKKRIQRQQKISQLINEQQCQLDRKLIEQSLRYLNQNNYNSVLNPVIEQNRQLQIHQRQQEQLLQQKLFQTQLLHRKQAQKLSQIIVYDEINEQNTNLNSIHIKSNRTLIKPIEKSGRSSVKLREKKQKSKNQLITSEKPSHQIQLGKFENVFVKYNDLYEYKKKVLKKRRNSDANINLQNYQPVIVKPVESPKKYNNTLHPSLPKRKYLEPQFKAEVVLLTHQAMRERRLSK